MAWLPCALESRNAHVVLVETLGLTCDTVREDPKVVAEAFGDHVEVSARFVELLVELREPPVDLFEPPVDLHEPPVDLFEPSVDLFEPSVDLFEPPVDPFEPPVDPRELATAPLVRPRDGRSHAPYLRLHRVEAPVHRSLELGDRHWFF